MREENTGARAADRSQQCCENTCERRVSKRICVYCANRQEKGLHLVFSRHHHACVDVLRFIDISIMVCVCAVQYKCMRNILFLFFSFFFSPVALTNARARGSLPACVVFLLYLLDRITLCCFSIFLFFPTYFCPLFSFMCLCTTM